MNVAFSLLVVPVVICFMTSLGVLPVQIMVLQVMTGNLRAILIMHLIAPITEEILFRGFIQERIEDLGFLIDRYVYTQTI